MSGGGSGSLDDLNFQLVNRASVQISQQGLRLGEVLLRAGGEIDMLVVGLADDERDAFQRLRLFSMSRDQHTKAQHQRRGERRADAHPFDCYSPKLHRPPRNPQGAILPCEMAS